MRAQRACKRTQTYTKFFQLESDHDDEASPPRKKRLTNSTQADQGTGTADEEQLIEDSASDAYEDQEDDISSISEGFNDDFDGESEGSIASADEEGLVNEIDEEIECFLDAEEQLDAEEDLDAEEELYAEDDFDAEEDFNDDSDSGTIGLLENDTTDDAGVDDTEIVPGQFASGDISYGLDETGVDEKFKAILHRILDRLRQWAHSHVQDWHDHQLHRLAMTRTCAALLLNCEAELILNKLLPGIPLSVQRLFSKSSWSLDDLLNLPQLTAQSRKKGIYANFATGNLKFPNSIGCETYIGQSVNMKHRIAQHLGLAEKYSCPTTPRPPSMSHSRHYSTIASIDIVCTFRALAVYDQIPCGYLMLLETFFVLLFDTCQGNGRHKFATTAAFELTRSIREELNLIDVQWFGMNAAFPMRQGFRGVASRDITCANRHCRLPTNPKSKKDEGPANCCRSARFLYRPGDPLGGYLCNSCYRWQLSYKTLPDKEICEKLQARRTVRSVRPRGVVNPACTDCGVLQLETRTKHPYKYVYLEGLQGFYCATCYQYVIRNERHRNRTSSGNIWKLTTKTGEPCGHCDAPHEMKANGRHSSHIFHRELEMTLCLQCFGLYSKMGHLPSQERLAERETRQWRYEQQKDQPCGHCQAPYNVDVHGKKHLFVMELNMVLCQACRGPWLKSGNLPKMKTIWERRVRQMRVDGSPIVCSQCSKVELPGVKTHRRHGCNELGNIFCRDCVSAGFARLR